MKLIVGIALFILGLNLNAQKNDVSLVVSSHYEFNRIELPLRSYTYGGSFFIGCKINNFTFYSMYQLGNSRKKLKFSKTLNNYNYHQLGIAFKYSFLNKEFKVRPYILSKFSTQIATNYKDGLMNNNAGAIIQTTQSLSELSSNNGPYFDTYEEYDSWVGNRYYQSTRFLGSLTFGADLKLFKGLELNIGTGFGIREIVTKKPITGYTQTY